MSIILPNYPSEAVPIGTSRFAALISDDRFIYFSNLVPLDSHPADDRVGIEAVFPRNRFAKELRNRWRPGIHANGVNPN
jgi:hypothetical protein